MNDRYNWKDLFTIGGIAAICSVALIPIQVVIFGAWPPPTEVIDWYALFQNNWLLGLLSLDLLYILNNIFVLIVYLALFIALVRENAAWMSIAFLLGVVGATIYFASNIGFEMLNLSGQYAAATTQTAKDMATTAGQTLLTVYTGTAFNVYYVLNCAVLLITALVMLRSEIFSKATAKWGIASGVLMIIPSTAGMLGMIFSLLSLIPWIVFCILIAKRLVAMGKGLPA